MPTVQSAVLPAGTPESATDFFGFGPVAAGGAGVSIIGFSRGLGEEGVELALVVVVAEEPVEIVARLHARDTRLLRSLRAQGFLDLERREVCVAAVPARVERQC